MHSIAKVIRMSHAKFHCNRLTIVQGIQDYASLMFLGHTVVVDLGLADHASQCVGRLNVVAVAVA